MAKSFEISEEALFDLDDILVFIAEDNPDAAERVEEEFLKLFELIASSPGIGHFRDDIGDRSLRFTALYRYVVVYEPDRMPLRILRILSGYRDVARILK